MLCPLCNQEIHDDSIFCSKCGEKVPRCPTCNQVLRKRVRFCTKDGTPIPDDIYALLPGPNGAPPAGSRPPVQSRPNTPAPKPAPVQKGKEKKKKNPAILIVIILLIVLALVLIGLVGYIVWDSISDGSDFGGSSSSSSHRDDDDDDDKKDPEDDDEDASDAGPGPGTETATGPAEEATEVTESPVITYEYRYEVIAGNLSWEQAKAACEAKGGYLATITSAEELATISALASKSGLTYLWIGASLPDGATSWSGVQWVTGEDMTYQNWYPGEPSIKDKDGTPESALCLWNAKYQGSSIGWTFNDQRNDLVGALPALSGKVGYICEYRIEVTE